MNQLVDTTCLLCSNKYSMDCIECNRITCLRCKNNYLNLVTKDCETYCESDECKDIATNLCIKCSVKYGIFCLKCDET